MTQLPTSQNSTKRPLANDDPDPPMIAPHTSSPHSSFRNVSACNRCRLRKNRCDQNLPACSACAKARQKCVGYDPTTKREIPRNYVYYLEIRVNYLEHLLSANGLAFPLAEEFNLAPASLSIAPVDHISPKAIVDGKNQKTPGFVQPKVNSRDDSATDSTTRDVVMSSTPPLSDSRLGGPANVSVARVVSAPARKSISRAAPGDRSGLRRSGAAGAAAVSGTAMPDSFFGLRSKPTCQAAPLPDRELGTRLVNLYFEHANPQIPILHRGEFMAMFDRTYGGVERKSNARELYFLNIVFAIGAGTILGRPDNATGVEEDAVELLYKTGANSGNPSKRLKLGAQQSQPEEYHASAMVHVEHFFSSGSATDRPEGYGGSLEDLQAVLLLAGFALLRPVAPGLVSMSWFLGALALVRPR